MPEKKKWFSVSAGERHAQCTKCEKPVTIKRTRYYQKQRGHLVQGILETTPGHTCEARS